MSELEREQHKKAERALASDRTVAFDSLARIAELEEENASMADDICSLTTAHDRAEQAEAALAERDKALDDLYFFLKPGDTVTVRTPGKRGSVTFTMDRLADLRARAERSTS